MWGVILCDDGKTAVRCVILIGVIPELWTRLLDFVMINELLFAVERLLM